MQIKQVNETHFDHEHNLPICKFGNFGHQLIETKSLVVVNGHDLTTRLLKWVNMFSMQ